MICRAMDWDNFAQAFSERAGSTKKEVSMEDVMLAIQAKATTSFVTPPSQDVIPTADLAHFVLVFHRVLHHLQSLPKVQQVPSTLAVSMIASLGVSLIILTLAGHELGLKSI